MTENQPLQLPRAKLGSPGVAPGTGPLYRRAVFWARRQPLGSLSLFALAVTAAVAVAAPLIAPHDPLASNFAERLSPPDQVHWMGTDHLGRDVYSRLLYGAQVSVLVGFSVPLFAYLGGTLVGLFSGFYGGWRDSLAQRFIDAIQVFPLIVLALAIVAVLRPGLVSIIIAVGIILMPRSARVVRGTVLSVKAQDYVQAAKAIGVSDLRLMLRTILPNCLAPLLVVSTADMATAILAEAALSFLGVGVAPPTPTWGGMLSESRYRMTVAPWLVIFPGIAISVLVLSVNLLGDTVRDVLDPRLRGS